MTSLESLVRRAGLTAERWYHAMERQLTDLPEATVVPELRLEPFTPDRDDEVRRAHERLLHRAPRLQRARPGHLAVAVHRAARSSGPTCRSSPWRTTSSSGTRSPTSTRPTRWPPGSGSSSWVRSECCRRRGVAGWPRRAHGGVDAGGRGARVRGGGARRRQRERDRSAAAVRGDRLHDGPGPASPGSSPCLRGPGRRLARVRRMVSAGCTTPPWIPPPSPARTRAVEPLHAQIYFAPELEERLDRPGPQARTDVLLRRPGGPDGPGRRRRRDGDFSTTSRRGSSRT